MLDGGDAELFRTLRLHALRSAPEAFGSSYEDEAGLSLNQFRQRLDDRPNAVFGAFADARLVGMAVLQ